jgi:hypothetical protein
MMNLVYEDMQPHLTEQNFVMFAMKHYQNPQCLNIDEFHDDLKRIKYVKRLLGRYTSNGDLKERLILNHLIILYNSFGPEATKMLFFKIDKEFWSSLKTFLLFLSYMPDVLYGVSGAPIISTDIPLDPTVVSALRRI